MFRSDQNKIISNQFMRLMKYIQKKLLIIFH